ncbi:hypothetical protein [Flavobacterium sp.]|uniref:hypothetical protein n=1 Tax=Flavobacterium sp. TaxID=239 RepID=UPI00286A6A7F|nr:hypothetical protein [Flavobacterium sp.]
MNNVPFINNFELKFSPFEIKKIYGVVVKTLNNDVLKNTMHYEIEVQCLLNRNVNFIFEINRNQVYINNLEPDIKIEQLADKASKAFYPIQIIANQFGQVDSVANLKSIKQNWLQEKETLLDYYKGDATLKIIESIDAILVNEDLLKQSLYKNWFFSLYFAPLYIPYTDNFGKTVVRDYPVFGNTTVKYEATHTVEPFCTETNKIIINVHGKAIDERNMNEVLLNYNYPKAKMTDNTIETIYSEMDIKYKLHADNGNIFAIIANFNTKIDQNTTKNTIIEIYQL